tara:strand:- start:1875 stop:2252 length:378 start_codon:yes stop_codon:yes gene_type:complete
MRANRKAYLNSLQWVYSCASVSPIFGGLSNHKPGCKQDTKRGLAVVPHNFIKTGGKMANTNKNRTKTVTIHFSPEEREFIESYSEKTFRSMSDTMRYALCLVKREMVHDNFMENDYTQFVKGEKV